MKNTNRWLTNEVKLLFSIALIGGVIFGLGAFYYKRAKSESNTGRASSELLVRPDSPTLGDPSAPVTMVEFFDPECESCRALAPMVRELFRKYDGKLRLVLRYMTFHFNSVNAALVTEAAGRQGKYWEMHDLLFDRQLEWGEKRESKVDLLVQYASSLGLDMVQFKQDLQDASLRQKIEQDRLDGEQLGAKRTPTFFINGKVMEEIGFDELSHAIEIEL